mmetsp:Transcript_31500/g.110868  ORF Transcript_31500/g.110868 Transcript_31500/m.110868 type:complete len:181 (+) Transcript_31500:161-703(+)
MMADLPGYGYAKLGKDEQATIAQFVSDYLARREGLRLVVLIVDSRREVDDASFAQDEAIYEVLRASGRRVVVVATKIDKISTSDELLRKLEALRTKMRLPDDELLYFSALTQQGRPELWAAMQDAFAADERVARGDDDYITLESSDAAAPDDDEREPAGAEEGGPLYDDDEDDEDEIITF